MDADGEYLRKSLDSLRDRVEEIALKSAGDIGYLKGMTGQMASRLQAVEARLDNLISKLLRSEELSDGIGRDHPKPRD
jgi:gamma-glutamyl phosphate reductase